MFFNDIIESCKKNNQKLIQSTHLRINSIIESSKIREDDVANKCIDQQPIFYHKNCVSSYTSKSHLGRIQSRNAKSVNEAKNTPPKVRRSKSKSFDFKTNCLFCGDICDEKVGKHLKGGKEL